MRKEKYLNNKTQEGIFAIACHAAEKTVGQIPLAGTVVNFACQRVEANDRLHRIASCFDEHR